MLSKNIINEKIRFLTVMFYSHKRLKIKNILVFFTSVMMDLVDINSAFISYKFEIISDRMKWILIDYERKN